MKIKKGVKAIPKKTAPQKLRDQQLLADSQFETFIKKNALLVYTLASLLLIFIVFRKFLLFDEMYLFKDIGSDSVNQIWPFRVHLSEYLRNSGFPKWSFNEGIGKNMYPLSIYPFSMGDPFNLAICLLPKDSIPYGTIFVEILKIYLGGLFFFLFLRTLKLTAFTSIIGGLLYSFSGFMILGSSFVFSTETLYASLVLYSCEKFLRQGTWYLLPIPFFLFAALQPFLLYLYGSIIAVYSIVRIAGNEGWQWKKIILTIIKIEALAFTGVIMSSFIFLCNIDLLLHIPRGLGKASSYTAMKSTSIFTPTSLWEFTTSLYRFFSSDLIGTGSYFNGVYWYIDSSTLYTGLLTCLLMPQAFFFMKKRERIPIVIVTVLAITPLFFPFFRYLFWLFSGEYYRTYSLFLSILFLSLCLKALSVIDSKRIINIPALFITLAILLILLYYPFFKSSNSFSPETDTLLSKAVNNTLRMVVASFLVIYTCIFFIFNIQKVRTQNFVSLPLILGTIILIEIACFSFISVNHRPVVSNAELHEKVGYNDYTNEAVSFLNSKDAGFFRIGKNYGSSPSIGRNLPYNDGLIQNYKSTSSYESFSQISYCKFLNELNVWSEEGSNYRLIVGPSFTRPLLSILLNEKYKLLKQPSPKVASLYDSLTTIGNVTITTYKINLPFGYTYQNYISLSEFRKLNNLQKDKMLFRAFVADTQDAGTIHESSLHQLYAKDTTQGTPYIDLNEYGKYVAALRQDSLSNLICANNTIKGTIKLSQTKLLFLTIPYDKGWQLKVDGIIVKTLIPNIGFTGAMLAQGDHTIELNYEPPFLKLGCYISGFSIFGYLFLFIRYRRKRL